MLNNILIKRERLDVDDNRNDQSSVSKMSSLNKSVSKSLFFEPDAVKIKQALKALRLEHYLEVFRREDLDIQTILELTKSEWDSLQIPMGHWKKLIKELQQTSGETSSNFSSQINGIEMNGSHENCGNEQSSSNKRTNRLIDIHLIPLVNRKEVSNEIQQKSGTTSSHEASSPINGIDMNSSQENGVTEQPSKNKRTFDQVDSENNEDEKMDFFLYRSRQFLIYSNYFYFNHVEKDEYTIWRCKQEGCFASITLGPDRKKILAQDDEHAHLPHSDIDVEMWRFRARLETRVTDDMITPPKVLYDQEMENIRRLFGQEIAAKFPSYVSMQTTLGRRRRSFKPTIDVNLYESQDSD